MGLHQLTMKLLPLMRIIRSLSPSLSLSLFGLSKHTFPHTLCSYIFWHAHSNVHASHWVFAYKRACIYVGRLHQSSTFAARAHAHSSIRHTPRALMMRVHLSIRHTPRALWCAHNVVHVEVSNTSVDTPVFFTIRGEDKERVWEGKSTPFYQYFEENRHGYSS